MCVRICRECDVRPCIKFVHLNTYLCCMCSLCACVSLHPEKCVCVCVHVCVSVGSAYVRECGCEFEAISTRMNKHSTRRLSVYIY